MQKPVGSLNESSMAVGAWRMYTTLGSGTWESVPPAILQHTTGMLHCMPITSSEASRAADGAAHTHSGRGYCGADTAVCVYM